MKKFPMVQVDVFTDRPLTGNSLAVFLDGRGLSTGHMQDLAREMNLSETTFVLPGDAAAERTRGVRVRIFTVEEELPFAGHPTLGTAFVLRGQTGAGEIPLDLNVGTVPVRFTEESGRPVFGEMTQKNPELGAIHNMADIASLTNLSAADFDDSAPIQTVSTGMPFTIVALRSLEAVRKLRLDLDRSAKYLAHSGGKFLYFVCRETVDPKARLHARMIFYNGDDPATGSAAGCCAAWMVAHGVAASDEQVLIDKASKCTVPVAFLFASRSRIIGKITRWSMCVSVEIVWKFSAVKSRSPSSGSKRCASRGSEADGTIFPRTRVPLASAALYRRYDSV